MKEVFLLVLFLFFQQNLGAQSLNDLDNKVLSLLSEYNAFKPWQDRWATHLQEFSYSKFDFKSQSAFSEKPSQPLASLILHPLLVVSPNGEKALNPWAGVDIVINETTNNYELAFDTSNWIECYDLTNNTSYEVLFTGNYNPKIDGVAWLNDSLFVAVGLVYDLSGTEDMVAPSVMIFDSEKRTIRYLVSEYIPSSEFIKSRPAYTHWLTEPTLMFAFE